MSTRHLKEPDVTIKWRLGEPPYVEVRHAGQLMVAGWVHPTPDGPPRALLAEANPAFALDAVHDFVTYADDDE